MSTALERAQHRLKVDAKRRKTTTELRARYLPWCADCNKPTTEQDRMRCSVLGLLFGYCANCIPGPYSETPSQACTYCQRGYRYFPTNTLGNTYLRCAQCAGLEGPAIPRPVYVYRMYSHTGELLYVGKTLNLFSRFTSGTSSHMKTKTWLHKVARVIYDTYRDDRDACEAEAALIDIDEPKFNRAQPRYTSDYFPRPITMGHDHSHVLDYV